MVEQFALKDYKEKWNANWPGVNQNKVIFKSNPLGRNIHFQVTEILFVSNFICSLDCNLNFFNVIKWLSNKGYRFTLPSVYTLNAFTNNPFIKCAFYIMKFIKLWRLNISNIMNNLKQPVLDRFWTTFYFDLFDTIKRSLIYTLTCCLTYNRLNICLDTTRSGNLCITKRCHLMQHKCKKEKRRKKKKCHNWSMLVGSQTLFYQIGLLPKVPREINKLRSKETLLICEKLLLISLHFQNYE